jgi:uncharacterized membrane protein YukC
MELIPWEKHYNRSKIYKFDMVKSNWREVSRNYERITRAIYRHYRAIGVVIVLAIIIIILKVMGVSA